MFRRKQEAAPSKFDIQAVIKAALEFPVSGVRESHYDDVANRAPSNIARNIRLWAKHNAAGLLYAGESSEVIAARLEALRDDRKRQAEALARCKVEIIQQTGGLEGRQAYQRAGIAAPVDAETLAKERAATAELQRIDADANDARIQHAAARDHDRVRAELVTMLAALLGGL